MIGYVVVAQETGEEPTATLHTVRSDAEAHVGYAMGLLERAGGIDPDDALYLDDVEHRIDDPGSWPTEVTHTVCRTYTWSIVQVTI